MTFNRVTSDVANPASYFFLFVTIESQFKADAQIRCAFTELLIRQQLFR